VAEIMIRKMRGMNIRSVGATLCAVLLTCTFLFQIAASVSAFEVPLRYQCHSGDQTAFRPGGTVYFQPSSEPPAGNWKLPTLNSEAPGYAVFELGDVERLLILDRQKPADFFFNRLYFDANGNDDLTDDPVADISFERVGETGYRAAFAGAEITVRLDGTEYPYNFRVTAEYIGLSTDKELVNDPFLISLYWNTNCSYTGTLEFETRKYHVTFSDENCNGLFNDRLVVEQEVLIPTKMPKSDGIYISAGEQMHSYDRLLLGDYILIDDNLLAMTVDISNKTLTVTPVEERPATLTFSAPPERMTIYTEDGHRGINMYRPGKQIDVPAGTYRLHTYQMLKKEDSGAVWHLEAQSTDATPAIAAKEGDTTLVAIGEPYKPLVDVPEMFRALAGSAPVVVEFRVEGRAGEVLTDLGYSGARSAVPLSETSPNRPKEPTYMIVKTDGEIAARGAFEYG